MVRHYTFCARDVACDPLDPGSVGEQLVKRQTECRTTLEPCPKCLGAARYPDGSCRVCHQIALKEYEIATDALAGSGEAIDIVHQWANAKPWKPKNPKKRRASA